MTQLPEGPPPFRYAEVGAKIPNYVVSTTWGQQGRPHTRMQLPLSPAESMQRMVTPQGFHVELFAAEPDLGGKPLAMNWDERGRLWVAESVDYPNELQPHNEGRDRIRICEDADRDGKADKFTVFAEGLSIPTSIAFARSGVIVHNGAQTLFLKDENGDDRADSRSVLLETWAMGDTHGGPSNMQYGLDNWIWGMQGYNKSTIRIGQKATSFGQGFHRFRTDGSAIEFVRSTNNNSWGLGISESGVIFGSTANGNPSEYMPIPNRYYEQVRGWSPQLTLSGVADSDRMHPITDKIRQVDHHGRHTAAAGHALYTARLFPRKYWNRVAFVCEPTGHLVGAWLVTPDGAGYRSTSPFNLLASDDEWTAPTMAEIGPDGCVWVIDWYNFIVQHNPTPAGFVTGKGAAYESDLRDKTHGRIYRVAPDRRKPAPPLDLSRASPAELVHALTHSNMFWRRHAQRLLVERAKLDVAPQLLELVANPAVDEVGLNAGAIHALWTLHGLGYWDTSNSSANAETLSAALRHASAAVRRNAVQVLPKSATSVDLILKARLLNDPDAQVRLQALLALAERPRAAHAGAAIFRFLSNPENANDKWLRDAATIAAASQGREFLAEACRRQFPESAKDIVRIVANHIARTEPQTVHEVIAAMTDADPAAAGAILAGFQEGLSRRQALKLSPAAGAALEGLRTRLPLEEQLDVAQLLARGDAAGSQQYLADLGRALVERAADRRLEISERLQAAARVIETNPQDSAVAEQLLNLATPQECPEFCAGIISALQASRASALGPLILDGMEAMTPAVREAATEVMLSRPALADQLLDRLEHGGFPIGDLTIVHKTRLIDYPNAAIRKRAGDLLAKSSHGINGDRQQVLDQFSDLATAMGDPAKGREVFTRHCAVCHRFRGEGASIGPDLTGMAVHGKQQLLVHILDPNRDVEGNFVTYTALRTDGLVVSGMLAGESASSVELVDSLGKRHAILREDLEKLSRSGTSLMPEGFEKQLTRTQIADLLAYLASHGKFMPLDLRRAATLPSHRGMFNDPTSDVERIVFEDWGPKEFQGVPFFALDPQDGRVRNVVVLHSPRGRTAPHLPSSVELECNASAKAIHFLGGVSGWGFPVTAAGTQSMLVRLRYSDGSIEDHQLLNGVHFADYLGSTEVPQSQLAFLLGRQQLRYFKVTPARTDEIAAIELIKGSDETAPIVMAVTVELNEQK